MDAKTLETLRLVGVSPASIEGLATMLPGPSLTEAGLSDWQLARLGKITGSNFHRVTLNRKGDGLGVAAETYLYEILGEHLTGLPASNFDGNAATAWGVEHEPAAIAAYEKATRRKVVRGKFYPMPGSQLIGCTPDGVGRGWGLEIKCPYTPKMHIRTLLSREVPDEYMDQVNGHMLVTGKAKCDFVSYDPRMKDPKHRMVIVTVHRDEVEMEKLKRRLELLETAVLEAIESIKS